MVAIKALTVLALAGAVVATPIATPVQVGEALERREAYSGRPNYRWSWRWGGQGSHTQPAPATETTVDTAPEAPSTEVPATAPQSGSTDTGSSDPAPAASTPTASTGGSSNTGYMAIVNEWRGKMGLSALTESSKLAANALDTSVSSGGQLVHKLNPGSMGQVMAPGSESNFESVFVGGWLCEMPSLPGLGSSVCDSASKGWDHQGQTGHAKLLTSPSYSQIGCGFADNMVTCDLA